MNYTSGLLVIGLNRLLSIKSSKLCLLML